jgi:endoglycosylceramidase
MAGAVLALGGGLAPATVSPVAAAGFTGGFVQAPGGPFMTDAFGRKLQFHGFNLVAKCPSFSKIANAPGFPCIPDSDHPTVPSYWLNPNPAYLSVDPERTFTDADAAQLADLGYNIARVGIIWRALEPGTMATPQANDPDFCTPRSLMTKPLKAADDQLDMTKVNAYLAHIDDTVNLLATHGIYSLLDMHQDDFSEHFNNPSSATPWEGEGAPLWATCTNLTGTTTPAFEGSSMSAGWAEDNIHDPALAMAADHFWSNDVSGNLQGQLIRVWQEVAKHYRNNQSVVGYDPFNEPYDQAFTIIPTAFDSRLQCFYAGSADPNSRCSAFAPPSQAPPVGFIPAIVNAAVDPNHLVFYEGPVVTDYHGIETIGVGVPLNYPNLVLNFHIYPPVGAFGGGECTSPACGPNDDLAMSDALKARSLTSTAQPGGPAMFASEFGAEDFAPDLAHDAALFDGSVLGSQGVSWAYWSSFQSHDPTGQPNERLITSDRKPVQPKTQVLSRAFPRATAGNPAAGAQKFDPSTAAFDFGYAPDHSISAPTEIVVPSARYGGGYKITVSAAQVTSPCGANPVTLVADQVATAVTFHVEPAAGCSPNFVTTVCNPASPTSPNNPCPGGSGGSRLPNTSAASALVPASLGATGLGLAAGPAWLSLVRRRTRRLRHP